MGCGRTQAAARRRQIDGAGLEARAPPPPGRTLLLDLVRQVLHVDGLVWGYVAHRWLRRGRDGARWGVQGVQEVAWGCLGALGVRLEPHRRRGRSPMLRHRGPGRPPGPSDEPRLPRSFPSGSSVECWTMVRCSRGGPHMLAGAGCMVLGRVGAARDRVQGCPAARGPRQRRGQPARARWHAGRTAERRGALPPHPPRRCVGQRQHSIRQPPTAADGEAGAVAPAATGPAAAPHGGDSEQLNSLQLAAPCVPMAIGLGWRQQRSALEAAAQRPAMRRCPVLR